MSFGTLGIGTTIPGYALAKENTNDASSREFSFRQLASDTRTNGSKHHVKVATNSMLRLDW